jgi:ACR3 family arsenite efflux pump ArsB
MQMGMKLVNVIITLAIAFGVIAGAFLPMLSTWANSISDINNVDYGWVVWLIAMIVVFALLVEATKMLGLGSGGSGGKKK